MAGNTNVYVCDKCGGYTVTIDRDEGTTPFMIGCRASGGLTRTCRGMAQSSFYRQRFPHGPPEWEWYKPDSAEIHRMKNRAELQHVAMGGLLLRPIAGAPEGGRDG